MRSHLLYILCLLFSVFCFLDADDWPQWRGIHRDGISREKGALSLWPPKEEWQFKAGLGYSSVVVSKNRLFVMGNEKREGKKRGIDTVFCLEAETGNRIWRHRYECTTERSDNQAAYSGPRATPVVDDDRVYTVSLEGLLFCLNTADGKVKWYKNLNKFAFEDLSGLLYGYCSTPVIYENIIICYVNGAAMAFDKITGKPLWRCKGGRPLWNGSSPSITEINGQKLVLFGEEEIVAANPKTGDRLWSHIVSRATVMAPIVVGRKLFYSVYPNKGACGVFEITKENVPKPVWANREIQIYHVGHPILVDGYLYGVDCRRTEYLVNDLKVSSLKCIEFDTGKLMWTEKKIGWAQVMLADGKLLIQRENGELRMVEPSPEKYIELGRASVPAGVYWSFPAIANGLLYTRSNKGLVTCFRASGEGGMQTTMKKTEEKEKPETKAEPEKTVESSVPKLKFEPTLSWPRFRGSQGNGWVPPADYPVSWDSEKGKGILWKAPIALKGSSSPVIQGNNLFLTGADKENHAVYCFDTETGKLKWEDTFEAMPVGDNLKVWDEYTYASSTGVTDGNMFCAAFADGDMVCYDTAGKLLWSKELGPLYNGFGYASSLNMANGRIIIQIDQDMTEDEQPRSKLIAVNPADGKTVWETSRPVANSWTSPIVAEYKGASRIITAGLPFVIGYDSATGRELWRVKCLEGDLAPSPISVNGMVFAAMESSYLTAINMGGSGDVTGSHIAWQKDEGDFPSICSPVSDGTFLYLVSSGGYMSCWDVKTGKTLWEEDLECSVISSPTIAGDKIYVFGEEGEGLILQAADSFKLLHKNTLNELTQASPAFVRNRIYIRTENNLYCLGK